MQKVHTNLPLRDIAPLRGEFIYFQVMFFILYLGVLSQLFLQAVGIRGHSTRPGSSSGKQTLIKLYIQTCKTHTHLYKS